MRTSSGPLSKDAEIMLPPSWKGEVEKTVQEATDTNAERQQSEDDKNASKIAAEIESLRNAYDCQNNKPKETDNVQRAIDITTVAFVFATAVFTGLAWWVFRGQLHVFETTDRTLKQTMEVGQRAYVVFDGAVVNQMRVREGIKIGYHIKNAGKTPTFNLRQHLFIGIRTPPVLNYDGIPWNHLDPIGYFGAEITVKEIEGPVFGLEHITIIDNGNIRTPGDRLYFIGRAEYRDIFEIERWVDFCFMYLKQPSGVSEFNFCDHLNDADRENHSRFQPEAGKP
jgi:hypothetical protein